MADQFYILDIPWDYFKTFYSRSNIAFYYVLRNDVYEAISIDSRYVYRTILTDPVDAQDFIDNYKNLATSVPDIDTAIALTNIPGTGFDSGGASGVTPGNPIGSSPATLVAGSDGTNARVIKTDSTGAIVLSGSLNLDANVNISDSTGNPIHSSSGSLDVLLKDSSGNVVPVIDGNLDSHAQSLLLVGGTDGTNLHLIKTDSSGNQLVALSGASIVQIEDSAGNSLTSTSNALDVNLKSQTNPIVTTVNSAVNNPVFVELTDGTNPFGTTGNPVFTNIQDGSGVGLTSSSGILNIGITGSNTVQITDSTGGSIQLDSGNLKISLFDSLGDTAVLQNGQVLPANTGIVLVGGSDGANAHLIKTDSSGNQLVSLTGTNTININDSAGNSLSSTSNALDVNLKSQTNPISTTVDSALNSPVFVELTDGTNPFGTTGNPLFTNIQDSSGNALTSTSNRLDVGITGANIVKIEDSSGNAISSSGGNLQVVLAVVPSVNIQDSSGNAISLSGANLKASLFDSGGNAGVVQAGAALPSNYAAVLSGGTDGTNAYVLKTDSSGNQLVTLTGTNLINIQDTGGNALTSTSNALDVNLKSQDNPINVSIEGNALNSPVFVELTDGTNSIGTVAHPLVTKIEDTAGNSITSTSGNLNVSIAGNNTVKIEDSSGNAISLSGSNLQTSLFDSSGNAAVVLDGGSLPVARSVVLSGGTDGTNVHLINTDSSGNQLVSLTGTNSINIKDSSGNSLSSTSNSLDVNLKSQTNPIGTTVSTAVNNPLFVELSDGTNPFGTSAHPIFSNIKDSSGNSLTSTSNKLDVGITGANVVKIQDSSGNNINVSSGNLEASLFDASGNAAVLTGGSALPANYGTMVFSGTDGTTVLPVKTDAQGAIIISGTMVLDSNVNVFDASANPISSAAGSLNVALHDGAGSSVTLSGNNLQSSLFDFAGKPAVLTDGVLLPTDRSVVLMGGSDGTNVHLINTDSSGNLSVVLKDGSGNSLSSTSNALDINLKSQSGPVEISANTSLNDVTNPVFVELTDGTNSLGVSANHFFTNIFDSAGNSISVSSGNLKTSLFNSLGDPALNRDGAALPSNRSVVFIGGSDGTNARLIKTDSSGNQLVSLTGTNSINIKDSSGNNLSSTSNALDVNLKSQTNPISTTVVSAVNNPVFVELTDGTNPFGTTGNALFVNLQDGAGAALTSTSNKLDVGITGANTVKIEDSSGNAINLSGANLQTSLFDASGYPSILTDGANLAPITSTVLVGGTDGAKAHILQTDSQGHIILSSNTMIRIQDTNGNSLTSTSNALDVNIESQTGTLNVSLSGTNSVRILDSGGQSINLSGANLQTSLFDSSGNAAVLTDGGSLPTNRSIVLIGGTDGTNVHALNTDSSGNLQLSIHGSSINIKDSAGNDLTSTSNALDVNLKSQTNPINITIDGNALNSPVFVELTDGTNPFGTTGNPLFTNIQDSSGNALTSTSNRLDVGITGANTIKIEDSSGNSLTSTASALDVNLKSQTNAIKVSSTTGNNTLANPLFVELSDGTNSFGTSAHPIFSNIQDSSGNSLTSTSNKLDVGITGANTVKIEDSSGNAINLSGSNLQTSLFDGAADPAILADNAALPGSRAIVLVGGSDGSNVHLINTDVSGNVMVSLTSNVVNIKDSSGNTLSSTSNALDVNLKSQTGSISTTVVSAVNNPVFVELTDGTNPFGTTGNALFVNLQDGSGTALTSTLGNLNVGIHDASGNNINVSNGNLETSLFDASGNAAVVSDNTNLAISNAVVLVGGTDGTKGHIIKTDSSGNLLFTLTGTNSVNIRDSSGNSLTSTASALDVNLKSQTNAIKVSATTGNNTLANPIFVELSDGTNPFGTAAHPLFSNIQDSSGNSLTSTSNKLDVGITGANIVKIEDSSGNAISLSGSNLQTSLFDSSGNAAVVTNASAIAGTPALSLIGGSDGTNVRIFKTDTSGNQLFTLTGTNSIRIQDSSGNSLTSTSNALNINFSSQAAAVKVSATAAANTLTNPMFVKLTDGTNAFGSTSNPFYVDLQDGSGNSLTSTSNKLDVGITGANTVKIQDSSGNAINLSGGNLKTSLFDSSGNAAVITDGSLAGVLVAGFDGTNNHVLKTDTSGNLSVSVTGVDSVKIEDSAGNSLTSTSNALDVNLKSQTNAIKVSSTTGNNTLANPIFVELSDGTNSFGTSAHPLFINLKDGSGNALTSTSNKLDVGITGANIVKIQDSSGSAITLSNSNLQTSLFDSSGNAAIVTDTSAVATTPALSLVGGSDGSNVHIIRTDSSGNQLVSLTGINTINIRDSSGNSLTSTASALDVNLKSQTNAIKVSSTTGNNTLANPIFVELSDGTNAFGTAAHPVFTNIQDSSGNSLTSTSNKLDVGITGANIVKIQDSSGSAITLAGGNLKTSLFDSSGNAGVVTNGSLQAASPAIALVGGSDGTNVHILKTDTSGNLSVAVVGVDSVKIEDSAGNSLTSTSNALDVNLKSQTNAIKVSATTGNNTLANPIFVELSDGTNSFGTTSNPVFVNLKDGSGNSLTSTSNKLDVGITGANTVKIQDSSGSAITLSGGNLKTSLFDSSGNAGVVTNGSLQAATPAIALAGGSDGTNVHVLKTDTSGDLLVTLTGTNSVNIKDSSGNSLTSTASALDVNLKSQTNAIKVSATTGNNALSNPIFVELSDGTNAFGTTSNPVFVNLKDGSGNSLTSTSNKLDVGITGANTVKITDSSGNSLTSTSNKLDVGLTGANTVKLNDSAGTAITLSGANLKTSLFDSSGNAAVVSNGSLQAATPAIALAGGSDGTNVHVLRTDTSGDLLVSLTGTNTINIKDSAGNSLTSTASALDVNLKSQTNAIKVSATTGNNAVANPIFVELTDGTNPLGTTGNPVFVNLKDGSGNALTSTSNKLDVGITGANTVKLTDSAGTAITLSGANLKTSLFDAAGDAAVVADAVAVPASRSVVMVGGSDGSNIRLIKTDSSGNQLFTLTGTNSIRIQDSSGNSLTSTASALDVNLKSQTNAIKVSATTGNNAVANPIFVELSDGTNPLGTTGNPVFINLKDGSGNALTSTSNKLDVGITGANTVKLTDSAGTAITLNTGGSLKETIYDASGNVAVGTKGTAFPGTAGVVIAGGTDGTNTQAIATDTSGRQKIVPFDNQGNTLALQAGTAVAGSQGGLLMAGSDGTNARLFLTDTSGRSYTNVYSVLNRDSTRIETALGQLKTAEENVSNAASFTTQLVPEETQRFVSGAGTFSYSNGALQLSAGTGVSDVRISGLRKRRYIPGVGVHVVVSVQNSSTGSSGCTRNWGAMDTQGLNGYFFQLSGTTLQISRRTNGADNFTTAASWNVNSAITADTNFHVWEVLYQWLGAGRIIFRLDGRDVHTIEYAGTASTVSTQNPDLVPWVEIQNTTTQGVAQSITVGCYSLSHENSGSRQCVAIDGNVGSTAAQALTANTTTGAVVIQFRSTKGASNISNQGVATIKKITASTGVANAINATDLVLIKNPLFGGSMTWTAYKHANDPNTEWNNTVQLTATASASAATGAGYGVSTNLAYKITVVGSIGETIPSTTSATVSSGNPAVQINLAWPPVTYATAYNIYRQNAGAGNYSFIGTTSGLSFTDNAFLSSATVPPGSSTAEGESFMQFATAVASGASGWTASTGKSLSLTRITGGTIWTQTYESGELALLPGESLLITALTASNGSTVTVNIEWEEGPPVER